MTLTLTSDFTVSYMNIGIFTAVTDEQVRPAALARAIEERGFESLFVPEHSHIPVRRETPYVDGAEIPRDYYRNLDPFVTLTAAATATTHLRIGTAIALVPQRDPILLAKEAASLDLISDGRFELGVGTGWLREEIRNHGTDPVTRVALTRERLAAVKALWTSEQAEFHGRFVDFDPVYQWPKPVQRPHPPVWVGGWGPTTFRRIIADGDGWLAPPIAVDDLLRGVGELAAAADQVGLPTPPVTLLLTEPTEAAVEKLLPLGIYRILFGPLPVSDADTAVRALDSLCILARRAGMAPATV
ncbi:putative F420-dependent oxidoreductase, Rv2161c family [Frankia sp. EI5c]|nr:putative F420-dependent oxidoreductase, Rv2161c family [Frankia sp. EI5c]